MSHREVLQCSWKFDVFVHGWGVSNFISQLISRYVKMDLLQQSENSMSFVVASLQCTATVLRHGT